MSCTAHSFSGYSGFTLASGRARSESAGKILDSLNLFAQHRDKTATTQLSKYRTLARLREVTASCSLPDWGGNDELPVSQLAISEALKLLEVLPQPFSSPEVSPEPTGAIAFEWRYAPMRILVFSMHGRGSIEYAGLLGRGTEFHGRSPFAGDLPNVLFRHLMSMQGA